MRQKLSLSILLILFSFLHSMAQQRTITGKVTDTSGTALSNASVTVVGQKTGVRTDADGNFSINVSPAARQLRITYVGSETQTVDISSTSNVSVTLASSAQALSDVVVVGYGTARKRDLTGAVSNIQAKDFNKGTYTSADLLVQGKAAGVQITTNSGTPGGATTVKIRGNSAITGSGQPLYVVDGVPLDGRSPRPGTQNFGFGGSNPASNPLNFLNPADIASIDVLKDASSTAIYGSRAAYGVVLITTKRGRPGETRIDLGASVGISKALNKIDILDASQFRQALTRFGLDNTADKGGNSDAFNEITRTGVVQNYNVGISGGTDNAKFRFSLGALNQEGIVRKTGIKKYTADFSGQFTFLESKKLGLDLDLIPTQYTEQIAPVSNNGGAEGSMVGQALQWNPTLPLKVKRANGTDSLVNVGGTSIINPLGLSEAYNDRATVTTVLASISPYYKFTSWLEYRFLYSINYGFGTRRTSIGPDINVAAFQGKGGAQIGQGELSTQQYTHTLNLNKQIASNLYLNAVAGFEYLKYTNKGFSLNAEGNPAPVGFGNFGLDYTNYIQYGNTTNRGINSYIDPTYELQSYFARTAFNYKDKYLLAGTFRVDGSTKFGKNNKYGYFPSFSAAWVLTKEDFFHVDLINSLKIRGSWGKTGNQEFPSGSAQARYALNGSGTTGSFTQLNNQNEDLRWQADRQYNVGMDLTILKNRIAVTVDYFDKRTTDLLFPSAPAVPAAPGAPIKWINLPGKIDNSGIEAAVNAGIINKNDISWDFAVNATFLKNKVSQLVTPGGADIIILTGALNGQGSTNASVEVIRNNLPINAFFTREFTGFDKTTGQALYKDNGNTFYYVGSPNPKVLFGVSTTFRYKKLSLTANVNGATGHKIYNETLNNIINVGSLKRGRNIALAVYENPIKESFSNPVTSSSRYLEKGDYLKMTNATLSYSIGNVATIFKGANVYITGQNLFVITKFSGFDPEVNVDKSINGVPSVGIEYAPYPSARTVTLGVNFSL